MKRALIGLSYVFLGLAACGKKDDLDCPRYAEHLAEINTRGLVGSDRESPRRTVRIASEQACRSGRVKASEVTCVLSASSAEQTTLRRAYPAKRSRSGSPCSVADF